MKNIRDKEKDLLIRKQFRKDQLVSKQYDSVFDNIVKGEYDMKEEIRQSKQEEPRKQKKNLIKPFAAVAACALIFAGANVYATTQGYDNIFFLIKDLGNKNSTPVTAQKEDILLDTDTTISYTNIKVAEGLFIQINRFIVTNGKAKLVITVNREETVKPYRFTISSNEITVANIVNDKEDLEQYQLELELNSNYKKEMKVLVLKIEARNGEVLSNLKIDLENKEIELMSSEEEITEVKKISEIDLKEKLGQYAIMLEPFTYSSEESRYLLGTELLYPIVVEKQFSNFTKDMVNQALREAGCEELGTNINSELFEYNEKTDSYEISLAGDISTTGLCLNIDDLKYKDGKYRVTFTYCAPSDADYALGTVEDLARYQVTLDFVLEENAEYTKYKVLNWATVIPQKVKEEKKEEEIQEHTHTYNVIKVSDNNYHTELDGTHTLRCLICGEEKQEPHHFGKWYALEGYGNPFWTLWCEDCNQYVYTSDYNVVLNSGYAVRDYHTAEKSIGTWVAFSAVDAINGNDVPLSQIFGSGIGISNYLKILDDGKVEYSIGVQEVVNGSYDTMGDTIRIYHASRIHRLYYDESKDTLTEEIEEENRVKYRVTLIRKEQENTEETVEDVDNYTSKMNWTEYWAPGIKFQYPAELQLEEIGENRGDSQGSCSTIINGFVKGIDKEKNEIVNSLLEIRIYEPFFIEGLTPTQYINALMSQEKIDNIEDLAGYNLDNSGRWYMLSTTDDAYRLDSYIHFEKTSDGSLIGYYITVTDYNPAQTNWKIVNIVNKLFGSIQLTSY